MIIPESLPGIKLFLRPLGRVAQLGTCWRLIAAFVMHVGRMSAKQAAEAIRTRGCHRGNVGRALQRGRLDNGTLCRAARRLLESELRRAGEWFFLIDSTFCSHQGVQTENTFALGNYRARPKHSQRRQRKTARRSSHGFVVGLLLTPRGGRVPLFRSYLTRDYCQRTSQSYRTQAELAAELIAEIPLPARIRVTVLGDTAFDAKVIRTACAKRNYPWIVPLNPERVLAGPRPRPKVSSLFCGLKARDLTPVRLTPGTGPLAAQHRVARCRRESRTSCRTFYVHGERHTLQRVGAVQLVFSTKEQLPPGQVAKIQKVLMSNELHWSPRQIVQRYALRWQIELLFKELKSTLGLAQYQFRTFVKVDQFAAAALLTFVYLEWCRWREFRRRGLTRAERERVSALRTHGLCRLVRQASDDNDLRYIVRRCRTPGGIRRLRRELRAVLPKEERVNTMLKC